MTTRETQLKGHIADNAPMNLRRVPISKRPFVVAFGMIAARSAHVDELTTEDPLPAVVANSLAAQATSITEVRQETIDEQ